MNSEVKELIVLIIKPKCYLQICALIGLTGLCCLSVTATELKQPDT